ncbi:polysaccharide pyruvyl transferase family protein [Coleofasciculus sp. FACHB-712]|uniref:polysaccharide pyruvyl transferase family protein n=1 Tax=Coleofasciculus sp. FACHB-712 TaxID=2692789 RepID=UPI001683FADB|nr:polysaccharide pyruvyl transferase family protein [Coleofasciculus sp. FACHB-712]MBD1942613.1 polysaccharide pyruvyl transferase family protein [Coleofasciculus sp. FACHB-712]
MKLFYYKFPNEVRNFGDDLNPWLWEKLIPGVLDEDESTAFFGIGTIINDRLHERTPKARKIVVFSSGVGYGKSNMKNLPKIDSSWNIYCLRGPLSAQALGVSTEFAVADGALLVRRLFNPSGRKVNKFAYMPHISTAESSSTTWKSICEQLGFGYIDPRWSTEEVLSKISETEVLLTEAMHGAIIADALRVPWITVLSSNVIRPFKWQDWCASIGKEYQPIGIMPISDISKQANLRTSIRYWFKKKQAAVQLVQIAKTSRPNLSDETHLERLTIQLEERLQKFKDDVEAGLFYE